MTKSALDLKISTPNTPRSLNNVVPKEIKNFIEVFSRLPSLGPRQATRLAFFLSSLDKASLRELESSLGALQNLDRCSECFFFKHTHEEKCEICSDPNRTSLCIAILEKETDLLALEAAGVFRGKYFILGKLAEKGVLETEQKLRLQRLKQTLSKKPEPLQELIIALNPTSIGDFTADLITKEFEGIVQKITRLSRGIPTGGEIEFADNATLLSSFEHRD